jgi:arylsulfatase A-like enzyme
VVSRNGVIFTPPADGKLLEHGGHDDDTRVALRVSSPHLATQGRLVTYPVSTTQVAPTIFAVLGVPPQALEAVVREGTPALPGEHWNIRGPLSQNQPGT